MQPAWRLGSKLLQQPTLMFIAGVIQYHPGTSATSLSLNLSHQGNCTKRLFAFEETEQSLMVLVEGAVFKLYSGEPWAF